jgi:regulator of replication initiation timing
MKINLRRAAALQITLREAAKTNVDLVTGGYSMPLWNVNDEQIARERLSQMAAFNAAERLEGILENLRDQVGKMNVKGKINSLLAENVRVNAQINRLQRLSKSKPLPSTAELEKQAASLVASNEKSSYGTEDSFNIGVFSLADIEKFKNKLIQLRRRQVEINDELIVANLGNEVTITDTDWTWLESQGIV